MELARALKVFILLALSIFVILFLISPQFTGWVATTLKIDIGIASSAQGCMYFLNQQSEVSQGNEISFFILLENCGNQRLNGNINLKIRNSSGAVVDESNSSAYSLDIFEGFQYNFTWNAFASPGNYTAEARDNYTGETIMVNSSFVITAPAPSPPAPAAPGAATFPTAAVRSFRVDAPDSVTIYRNSNQSFLIRVTNDGEEALSRVVLSVYHENITTRTSPESIPSLGVNSTVVFFVEMDAGGVKLGDYRLLWEVYSLGIRRNGTVLVRVVESPAEEQCRDSVSYYLELMDILKDEITAAAAEGKNVTLSKQLFDDAMYELMAMNTYYDMGLYQECVERTDIVRKNIEEIVEELSRAKYEPLLVILPLVYQLVFWSSVTLVIVVAVVLLLRKLLELHRRHVRKNRLILPRKWS